MEWVSSCSSFNPFFLENDDLLFQTPYVDQFLLLEDDQIIPNTTITTHQACPAPPNIPFSETECDKLKGNINRDDDVHKKNEKKKQKVGHKEVERQRRLEMSSLHASLRSLLPLNLIKGQRSMSDHLESTVKYIRELQKRIEAKSEERDALKLEMCNSHYEVTVNNLNDGSVEVIVSTSSDISGQGQGQGQGQGVLLSDVLRCLTTQGLDVVSWSSYKLTNKLIYTILAQVEDGIKSNEIDVIKLQKKLVDMYP